MDISLYDVIRGPWVTEKAYTMNQKLKKLVLYVHQHANKVLVAQALKRLFNIEAKKISVIVVKGKRRKSGRFMVTSKKRKKAIVTLKPGQEKEGLVQDLAGWATAAEPESSSS